MSILDIDNENVMTSASRSVIMNEISTGKYNMLSAFHHSNRLSFSEDGVLSTNYKMCISDMWKEQVKEIMKGLVESDAITTLDAGTLVTYDSYVNGSLLPKNIKCDNVEFSKTGGISDIKINISEAGSAATDSVVFNSATKVVFKNVNIEYGRVERSTMKFQFCYPASFKGLESNVESVEVKLVESWPEYIENMFDYGYEVEVDDQELNVSKTIPLKNLKKILSVANNPKKYYLKSQLLKLRDGVKVSDFISPEAMPNLKNLTIGNGVICIDFFKDIKYNSRVKDFARIPWDLRGLPWNQRFVKTEDGFYVCIRQNIL